MTDKCLKSLVGIKCTVNEIKDRHKKEEEERKPFVLKGHPVGKTSNKNFFFFFFFKLDVFLHSLFFAFKVNACF